MTKYNRLLDYLNHHDSDDHLKVSLSFDEVAQIIDRALPNVLTRYAASWHRQFGALSPNRAWQNSVWIINGVDMKQRTVSFRHRTATGILQHVTQLIVDDAILAGYATRYANARTQQEAPSGEDDHVWWGYYSEALDNVLSDVRKSLVQPNSPDQYSRSIDS